MLATARAIFHTFGYILGLVAGGFFLFFFLFCSGNIAHHPAAIVSPLRAITICSMASHRHRDAFLPSCVYLHACAGIAVLRLLVLPSHVLETTPFFPNTSSRVAGQDAHQMTWNWLNVYCPCNCLAFVFSSRAHPRVLPYTDSAAGPSKWFSSASQTWVSHSVVLLQVCPCSFLHSEERKWRKHDTSPACSHCHHPTWSKAATEKSHFQSFFGLLCSLVTVLTSCELSLRFTPPPC